MAIGPQGPLLKNDGPACHVCGCTEHNACTMIALVQTGKRTAQETTIGCSWVDRPHWFPPLCTACAGSAGDLAATLKHIHKRLMRYGGDPEKLAQTDRIALDALARWKKRPK